jgi:NAD(P)-dependent dehydrogenase (short-subunit alcohol dehydrogenase family)
MRASPVVGDVTREEDVAALFATALDRFGAVDASFHVAGANRQRLYLAHGGG